MPTDAPYAVPEGQSDQVGHMHRSRQRRGGALPALALSGVAAAALLAAGLLPAASNGLIDADATRIARAVVDATRAKAGATPLADHAVLRRRAEHAATLMAAAVAANPTKPETPQELDSDGLTKGIAGAARTAFYLSGATSARDAAGRVTAWAVLRRREITHLGLAVARVPLRDGSEAWVVAALAAQFLPTLRAEQLNGGKRDFALACHLCGHAYLGRVQKPKGKNTGSLATLCPKCRLRFDLFGLDTAGRYHRPPWFLGGFQPEKVDDPLSAWLTVLTGYRYVSDRRRYGREEVWQRAEETHRHRTGDCEDTAILLADWLAASGHAARVVIGQVGSGGHAWVVLRAEGRDYILETTGGRGHYRRFPPRAAALPRYFPQVQFDRKGIWFRTANTWTPEYTKPTDWARGPWKPEPPQGEPRTNRR